MKRTFLYITFLFFLARATAQVDYSGNYGFQMKVNYDKNSPKKPTKEEVGDGRMGSLTLFKIDANRYKFWLSASRGWPSYNQGEVNGIIELKDGKATYRNKLDYADSACLILFTFTSKEISIEQASSDADCGFGHSVYTDGKYKKKSAGKLTNHDLQEFYRGFTKFRVVAAKAVLYEDSTGARPKPQYFVKNDALISIQESIDYVYVEYISGTGKFIYGWLRRSDVKASN